MDKRDAMPSRTFAWLLVDESYTELFQRDECTIDPLDFERDVMEARPTFLQKLFETRIAVRRDEFDVGLAHRKQNGVRLLGLNVFSAYAFDPQNTLHCRGRLINIFYANSNVINLRNFHMGTPISFQRAVFSVAKPPNKSYDEFA